MIRPHTSCMAWQVARKWGIDVTRMPHAMFLVHTHCLSGTAHEVPTTPFPYVMASSEHRRRRRRVVRLFTFYAARTLPRSWPSLPILSVFWAQDKESLRGIDHRANILISPNYFLQYVWLKSLLTFIKAIGYGPNGESVLVTGSFWEGTYY